MSKEEREANASSDVTAALRRTHDAMAAELQRSHFAHDTLKESTAALEQLDQTYSSLDTLLASSKNLLGTLLRSQKSDTWYLETAFYILAATLAWLVFRRILWWPLWVIPKLVIRFSMGIFAALGVTGGKGVQSVPEVVASHKPVVEHRSAGRIGVPSGARGPPGVNVGGAQKRVPVPGQEESVSEQVGRIIDKSNEQLEARDDLDDLPEDESAEIQRNPKKRVWEEEVEAVKEEQRKDEL